MWIVQVALRRPYTFLVMALLILLATPLVLSKMATDIFPEINIPVISIIWNYGGLSAQEVGSRITAVNERSLTTTVNDIEHIESQSLAGIAVIKIFFQPNANIPTAIAQVVSRNSRYCGRCRRAFCRRWSSSTRPPAYRSFNWGSPAPRMTEQAVLDSAINFLRPRMVTIPGVASPWPYGGKQRVISVDLDTNALLAKGLTPTDVVAAVNAQNLVLPSGTGENRQHRVCPRHECLARHHRRPQPAYRSRRAAGRRLICPKSRTSATASRRRPISCARMANAAC